MQKQELSLLHLYSSIWQPLEKVPNYLLSSYLPVTFILCSIKEDNLLINICHSYMDNTYNRHQDDTSDLKMRKAILEFFWSPMFYSAVCTKTNFKILLF